MKHRVVMGPNETKEVIIEVSKEQLERLEAPGPVAAMLARVKQKALASKSPKRKRKRDQKHKAKHIVRRRVKEARQRNRR